MFIANYAKTIIRCPFCMGKSCSFCKGTGNKEKVHLILSQEPLNNWHLQVQKHLKTVNGDIVE